MKSKYQSKPEEVYGYYTVLVSRGRMSYCRCSCGVEKWVLNKRLMVSDNPKCKSCFAKNSKWPQKIFHAAWNAVSRCTNPKHKRYADWGGRGIRVFPEWTENLGAFCDYLLTLPGWDDKSLVLDRIDNDGHYEPGNLRWATRSQSQKNQRQAIPRSEKHLRNLSLARKGKPWSRNQRLAHDRRVAARSSSNSC